MTIFARTIGGLMDETMAAKLPAVALALLLGGALIYGVALASPSAIHNAAHDGRHTFAFPCH